MKKNKSGAIIISNKPYDLNALGAIRSLGQTGVNIIWVTPAQSKWYYSKFNKAIICPDFTTDEKRFIQFLLKLGKKRKHTRDVLIPTSDASLIVVSKNKKVLAKYYIPMIIVCQDN